MAGAVPGRVTEIPAVAQPKRTASTGSMPRASAAAKPPLNASPAPVVSTTGPALKGGTCTRLFGVAVKRAVFAQRDDRGPHALCQKRLGRAVGVVHRSDGDARDPLGLAFIGRDEVAERQHPVRDGVRRGPGSGSSAPRRPARFQGRGARPPIGCSSCVTKTEALPIRSARASTSAAEIVPATPGETMMALLPVASSMKI